MLSAAGIPKDQLLFTEKQLYWRDKARKFAESIPRNEIICADQENKFRRDLFETACLEGFGALPFGTEYGGAGGDYVSFCLVNEELARGCCPVMSTLGVHVLSQEPVYRFGTEAQKQKYLPNSSTGAYLAAFGLTEPDAGSDTAAIQSVAAASPEGYILNGSKVFITSGGSADYVIVMAKIDDPELNLSGSKSISTFIVEKDSPGFQVGRKFDLMGMRGYATCEIVFDNCQVPKENLLRKPGSGRTIALSSLARGRVTIAAQATGWAQGALDVATRLLRDNSKCSGRRQDALEAAASFGELLILVESARALTYAAAHAIDRGQADATLASMAKLKATDVAMQVSTEAMSIVGKSAASPVNLLERFFRDAKAGQIYEGTNQIQRSLIARSLLARE